MGINYWLNFFVIICITFARLWNNFTSSAYIDNNILYLN
jgi:hypothetical protein